MVGAGGRAGPDGGQLENFPELRRRRAGEVPGVRRPHARLHATRRRGPGRVRGGRRDLRRHRRRWRAAARAGRRRGARGSRLGLTPSTPSVRRPGGRGTGSGSTQPGRGDRGRLRGLRPGPASDLGCSRAVAGGAARSRGRPEAHRAPARRGVWQNDRLSPACPDPLIRASHDTAQPAARPTGPALTLHEHARRHHTRGRQDSPEAHGQDPCAVLPRRRRRLPQEAGRSGHRGDREVPPQGGALADRGHLRPGAVLARCRRPADRGRRGAPQDHRRLADVQGPAGHRGHLAGQGAKRDKAEIFNEALKEAGSEPKAEAVTKKSAAKKADKLRGQARRPGRRRSRGRDAREAAAEETAEAGRGEAPPTPSSRGPAEADKPAEA